MGKVTIQSMAKELGLSRNTVAMALKDDPKVAPVTRERVLRMAKRNGYLGENVYVEEVRAPQEKHYNIMVLRTRDAAVYWDRVVSGISEEASLNNCQTRVAVVTEREEENGILPLGLNENIDAIFCIKMLPPEYMQKLVNLGYRIFQLDHYCGIEQRPMGDIVRVDDSGRLFLVDRKKDIIKSHGETVYPREVEEVLVRHQTVAEAAVVGVADHIYGELVKAYVVTKPGSFVTEQELIRHCATWLARYKIPSAIEFRQELPRTIIGKVLRRLMRDEALRTRETGAVHHQTV